MKKDDAKLQLIIEPSVSVEKIRNEYGDKVTQIKSKDGANITSGTIGTGAKVTIEGKTYTVVKLGDVSGDGIVDAKDALRVLKSVIGQYEIKNEYFNAADIDKNSTIDAKDALRMLKNSIGEFDITI